MWTLLEIEVTVRKRNRERNRKLVQEKKVMGGNNENDKGHKFLVEGGKQLGNRNTRSM